MSRKDASFWSEIKSLDERLKRDPDSFCFARLSEVYLKVGLVEDAMYTARTGVARHPGYLAGQKALALACNASGLHGESRSLLAKVTAVMPEDVEAQKVYASLCFQAGDSAAAIKAYETVLDFRPDDVQSKLQLEALQHGEAPEPAAAVLSSVAEDDDEEIFDLDEADIIEEGVPVVEATVPAAVEAVTESPVAPHHDPLSTLTLGELYEQQGFTAKALDIYRSLLAEDAGNKELRERIARLEEQESAAGQPAAETMEEEPAEVEACEDTAAFETSAPLFEEAVEEPAIEETVAVATAVEATAESTIELAAEEPGDITFDEPAAEVSFEEAVIPEASFDVAAVEDETVEVTADEPAQEIAFEAPVEETAAVESAFSPAASFDTAPTQLAADNLATLAKGSADNVVETLDGWLENIRRIKACR